MPMSPRLLRPRRVGNFATDADARAYIEAVRIADGSYMERDVQLAINAFIAGCKTDGIFAAIRSSCILMGARTLAGALTPLVGTAPTNNGPFVSGDYNRETGLVGDSTAKFLSTNRNNNDDPQNSQHLAIYASTIPSGEGRRLIGTVNTNGGSQINSASGNCGTRSRANAATTHGAYSVPGMIGISRAASNEYSLRLAGATSTISVTSVTPSTGAITVLGQSGGAFSGARLAFYSVGESLDLLLLETRVAALYTAIGAAL